MNLTARPRYPAPKWGFKSTSPYYGRTYVLEASDEAVYSIRQNLTSLGTKTVVPVLPFEVTAFHAIWRVNSPVFTENISSGEETGNGLDPLKFDTDGDGLSDKFEVDNKCNQLGDEITTVTGKTVDENSEPVQGAIVQVLGKKATTDGNGNFSVNAVVLCRRSGANRYIRPGQSKNKRRHGCRQYNLDCRKPGGVV